MPSSRALRIQLLLRHQRGFRQFFVTAEVAARVSQRRLIFGQLALRLSERYLPWAGIDFCQQRAGLHLLTFCEVQRHQLAIDPAAHRNGVGRGDGAKSAKVIGHAFGGRRCGLHRCQRTASAAVVATASVMRLAISLVSLCWLGRMLPPVVSARQRSQYHHANQACF